jgi:CRISPR-associated protein Csb2
VGGVDCRRHSLGGRDYLARKFITHLRLNWPRPIPGPLLIGRGRYFGMGLLLPQADA